MLSQYWFLTTNLWIIFNKHDLIHLLKQWKGEMQQIIPSSLHKSDQLSSLPWGVPWLVIKYLNSITVFPCGFLFYSIWYFYKQHFPVQKPSETLLATRHRQNGLMSIQGFYKGSPISFFNLITVLFRLLSI